MDSLTKNLSGLSVNWSLGKNGGDNGSFSLKLGVTGAPETFLIIDGEIVRHRIGEVNLEVWNEKFAPYF